MNRNDCNSVFKPLILTGGLAFLASFLFICCSPEIIFATMGFEGDGIGQFFSFLMLCGAGLVALCISSVFLIVLGVMAWIS